MEEYGVVNDISDRCCHCGKDRNIPVHGGQGQEIDMEKYQYYGVSDYEDDEYCTISTEDIDLTDLECDERFSGAEILANFSEKSEKEE